MAPMPARMVRRRRDGLVQIRPARILDRLRPVVRNRLLAVGFVLVGSLASLTQTMAFHLLATLFGLWALRRLWRALWPRPRVRLAVLRRPERPRLAVVPVERSSRS